MKFLGPYVEQAWSAAKHKARALIDDVEAVPGEVLNEAAGALAAVEHAGKSVFEWASAVPGAFSVDRNLSALKSNDTYSVVVSANVSRPGVKLLARGNLDVKLKPDGTYVVGASGEAFAGLFGMRGTRLGATGEGIEGFLAPGVGGRMEVSFSNLRDAEHGLHALESLAMGSEDRAFLAQHLSAIEVRGALTAETKSRLGLGTDRIFSGLFGVAGGRADEILRVEFPPGHAPALVLKSVQSGELSSSVSYMQTGRKVTVGSRTGLGAAGRGTATLEQRFNLPDGFTASRLLHHPAEAWGDLTGALSSHRSYRLTLTSEVGAQLCQNGHGTQDKLVLENDGSAPQDLHSVLLAYFEGQGETVARKLGVAIPGAQVDFTRQRFQQAGFGLTPEIRVMGFGFGTEVGAIRRNLDSPGEQFHHASAVAAEFS